jgi:large subunit ribosomal protein L24
MSLRIKKGDKVQVISGKDKGKSGKVLKVLLAKNRVVIEGINLVKKHFKKRSESEPGGIKDIPLSVHISNVALVCSSCGKGVKTAVQTMEDKSKIRLCRKCKQSLGS